MTVKDWVEYDYLKAIERAIQREDNDACLELSVNLDNYRKMYQ